MIRLMVSTAASYSIAPSVMAILESSNHTSPKKVGTGYTVSISIGGGTSRPSLYPVKYGGVDNIVALMNNGYSTSHDVWGEWHGNFIYGRRSRPALGFMQQAVAAFNAQYGSKYNVTATLSGEYQ